MKIIIILIDQVVDFFADVIFEIKSDVKIHSLKTGRDTIITRMKGFEESDEGANAINP